MADTRPSHNPKLFTYGELFDAVRAVILDLPREEIKSALDVPAGGGALTKFLKEEMGLDAAASDFDLSKWDYPAMAPVQGDLGRRLPFGDASFDLVVCMEGLKHVTDQQTAVTELARVLSPGGYMVITMSNDLALQCRLRYLFTGFVDADRKSPQGVGDTDDNAFMYVRSLVHLPYLHYFLSKCGVELLECRTSRFRTASLLLAIPLYPFIWLFTNRAIPAGHPLRKQMISLVWLAGRHNVLLLRKIQANAPDFK